MAQGERWIPNICAVVRNINCCEAVTRQNNSNCRWQCCQISRHNIYSLWRWTPNIARKCGDCRKLSMERSYLVAARVVFVKGQHEIKQSISDILRIIISYILLSSFPRKFSGPLTNQSRPPAGAHPTL